MQVVTTDSGDGNVHLMSADGGTVLNSMYVCVVVVVDVISDIILALCIRYWVAECLYVGRIEHSDVYEYW